MQLDNVHASHKRQSWISRWMCFYLPTADPLEMILQKKSLSLLDARQSCMKAFNMDFDISQSMRMTSERENSRFIDMLHRNQQKMNKPIGPLNGRLRFMIWFNEISLCSRISAGEFFTLCGLFFQDAIDFSLSGLSKLDSDGGLGALIYAFQ